MSPRPVIVFEIRRHDAVQMTLVKNDEVIQAFPAQRTDESLDVRRLPGAARRDYDFFDAQARRASPPKRVAPTASRVRWSGGFPGGWRARCCRSIGPDRGGDGRRRVVGIITPLSGQRHAAQNATWRRGIPLPFRLG